LSVASSADGTRLVAGTTYTGPGHQGYLYTSVDSGNTWTTTTNTPGGYWYSVATSADGGVLYAGYNGIWTSRTTIPPTLNIASSNNALTLSWIIPSTNFVLQMNSDLTTTNSTAITNAPTLILATLQNQVTLPAPGAAAFFRLVSQ
jgi:hypothetical protein